MKRFGLTGNIGCGKSTVAAMLGTCPSVVVIDCDALAKQVIAAPEYRPNIIHILGSEAFSVSGPQFKVIASIIFADQQKKQQLENFVHPMVWQMVETKMKSGNSNTIFVVESAIIFESQAEHKFDAMITVTCSSVEQHRRLLAERYMSETDVNARIAHQWSSIEKEKHSAFVVNTDCDREELQKRVAYLYKQLTERKGKTK